MITIVDYGCGNLGALSNMFDYLGAKVTVTSDPDEIFRSPRVVLPGVGPFDVALRRINGVDGLRDSLIGVSEGKAGFLLGICLGMQLLGSSSEEGLEAGLGLFDFRVQRFPAYPGLKVPHVGWANVRNQLATPHTDSEDVSRFYFSHSYFLAPEGRPYEWKYSEHGVEFVAAVKDGNVWGAQFHPEKSHRFGREFLQNFLDL